MASRAVVPQTIGEAGAVVKQKGVAAEANNRRALGDIGNVVNTRHLNGKPQLEISRPITRSFGAQLLANAQAAVANKKSIIEVVDGGVLKVGTKVVKHKATTKPKPESIIEISSDSDQSKSKSLNRRGGLSRKKVHTLTSVLTARSKVACGLTDKPKEQVLDIDSADCDNQLAVADYVEDIYKFYKLAEGSVRAHDYMENQPEINEKMRAILVDWLIEVHCKFELMPESLYLTIHIVDRYLSIRTVPRKNLQLVGITAMLLACKYEEIWAPEVNDFISISDRAYSREQILGMEKDILNHLEWTLTVPTPYVFLVRFIKASASDMEMENLVFFFAELSLMQHSMTMYCPSMIAASAVYAARSTLNKTPLWTETLRHHTGFSEQQLKDCTRMLVNSHSAAGDSKLKVVYKKYSSPQYNGVAMLMPAGSMISS